MTMAIIKKARIPLNVSDRAAFQKGGISARQLKCALIWIGVAGLFCGVLLIVIAYETLNDLLTFSC